MRSRLNILISMRKCNLNEPGQASLFLSIHFKYFYFLCFNFRRRGEQQRNEAEGTLLTRLCALSARNERLIHGGTQGTKKLRNSGK